MAMTLDMHAPGLLMSSAALDASAQLATDQTILEPTQPSTNPQDGPGKSSLATEKAVRTLRG